MSKRNSAKEMVSTKNKNKVLVCSTPEHRGDSPSRDSDSICDSESSSPVPFLCTQDGAEGETAVVWNHYTPKSHNKPKPRDNSSTPLGRKSRISRRPKVIEQIPKRKQLKPSQHKNKLFEELQDLNKNLSKIIEKEINNCRKPQISDDDDLFVDSQVCSPKMAPRSNGSCLRKNVLSSNFGRSDNEAGLDSDDSNNEYLIKATQNIEEKIMSQDIIPAKRIKYDDSHPSTDYRSAHQNMASKPALFNNRNLISPAISKAKKCDSPSLKNDSFDNLLCNLDDSALEQLTQMPIKTEFCQSFVKGPTNQLNSSKRFGRHNTMPPSPSVVNVHKPSTSSFGQLNTECDSDDSINEFLFEASQIIEDKIKETTSNKRNNELYKSADRKDMHFKMDQDSMDEILKNIKLYSPSVKTNSNNITNVNDRSGLSTGKSESKGFARHNSMPISPSVTVPSKPSTSGFFTRYSSMPFRNDNTGTHDSPTKCTQEEIKKKHQQAREKLAAKRQLPFTSTQHPQTQTQSTQQSTAKITLFKPKVPSNEHVLNNVKITNNLKREPVNNNDIKQIIERKRQEALMKLKRRQNRNL